jgi:hypothetical protein
MSHQSNTTYSDYDMDKNGYMDTPKNRYLIGLSLKNIYENYWLAGREQEKLQDIAEKIIGQRIFGYESHPVAKQKELYAAWMAHMEGVYAKEKK